MLPLLTIAFDWWEAGVRTLAIIMLIIIILWPKFEPPPTPSPSNQAPIAHQSEGRANVFLNVESNEIDCSYCCRLQTAVVLLFTGGFIWSDAHA